MAAVPSSPSLLPFKLRVLSLFQALLSLIVWQLSTPRQLSERSISSRWIHEVLPPIFNPPSSVNPFFDKSSLLREVHVELLPMIAE